MQSDAANMQQMYLGLPLKALAYLIIIAYLIEQIARNCPTYSAVLLCAH